MNRWPKHDAWLWETSPFFRLLLPLVAGILCYDAGYLLFSGNSLLIAALAAFGLMVAVLFSGKHEWPFRLAAFGLMNAFIFCLSLCNSWHCDIRNNPYWFGNRINGSGACVASVSEAPAEKENSWKIPVAMINTVVAGGIYRATGDAFVYVRKDGGPMLLHKGDTIFIPNNWQPIKNAGNPFEFDYAKYCRQNNIFYSQFCPSGSVRLYATHEPNSESVTERVHDWCIGQLDKYLPDHETKGLVQAMLLGDEVNLDEDIRQSYADTGIIHIIAISGGNVMIFFAFISAMLWWMRNQKHRWIKYAIALPLVWFYVLMAGAAPSAIRAAIMFSLLAFSVMFQRGADGLNTLFATAFILLFAQPMWLFSLGFQLSFVAVLSIIIFYKPIRNLAPRMRKIPMLIWETVAVSIAAEILVAPLIIYYFHMFPLLFIIANVAAYLFMSLVLYFSMAIVLLGWAPVAAHAVGVATIWLVTKFDKLVSILQGLSPKSFHFLMITGSELILVYLSIAALAIFILRQRKPSLFIGLAGVCLLLLFFCYDEWITLTQQKLLVYNVAKTGYIELINGQAYNVIHSDSIASKKIAYATVPAHINWHAWKNQPSANNKILDVNGKTALVLTEPVAGTGHFPVDYLVIDYPEVQDINQLIHMFSPSIIVLSSIYGERELGKLEKTFSTNAPNIFAVSEKGGFVLK